MSANNNIAKRDTEAQLNTFVRGIFEKERNNEYHVYFYRAVKENEIAGVFANYGENPIYDVLTETGDDIFSTYEKTVDAYKMIMGDWDFDILIRCNISCYINIGLLDKVINDDYNREMIVANSINSIITLGEYANDLYARGDFYIIHSELLERTLKTTDLLYNLPITRLDHVDDVLLGVNVIYALGDDYCDNLKSCLYTFIPYDVPNVLNAYSLSFRLKTCPEGTRYSGYGWDGEEVRMKDVEKFHKVHDYIKDVEYDDDILLEQLLYSDDEAKEVIRVSAKNVGLDVAKEMVKKKRAK